MSLEKLRTARTVAGIHQVCRVVESGAAEMVFIAADVDERVLGTLLTACRDAGIIPDRTATKAELGAHARLDVGAAAVAILR
ncbi:ribosomal protein L7Ae [Selenomonas sp. FOBRC6]|jgi:ribosomal protein L7ae family protein|uniref:ribosomal L7Ae/L30e/S12e/Gadd45 family protein n=1 Tax=Selenomonas sp. FOBRC6 TaxID=936572 RepID=UPI00027815B1|nr:ribosomal L7Ae/L30e/S12e/Gadd45 family protein [Selenomonas sp. FOBRC6]EJO22688.1 ribosomal protein L7Ae [Selenomonas sp. FOBRC6]